MLSGREKEEKKDAYSGSEKVWKSYLSNSKVCVYVYVRVYICV